MMDQLDNLDYVLVPLGIVVLGIYHVWLILTVKRYPTRTVIGLNAESRRQWVFSIMDDPLKNGVLAVQTIRNNIMASSLLATTAITLSSLISVYVSNTSDSVNSSSRDSISLHGTISTSSIKFFSILVCFLLGFLCNVQCLRYYAHVSFLATLPTSKGRRESIEYVVANLNRGSFFWSLGLRAFYFSFPLFLWVFGPISMFLCCCVMSVMLYFLDKASSFTQALYSHSINEETKSSDVESVSQPTKSAPFDDCNLQWPLLTSHGPVSTSAIAQ